MKIVPVSFSTAEALKMTDDGKPSDLPLYPCEPATIGCYGCHHVFRTEKGVQTDLGDVAAYESVHKPVSGWTRCDGCKAATGR